jgi:hypothetical protein
VDYGFYDNDSYYNKFGNYVDLKKDTAEIRLALVLGPNTVCNDIHLTVEHERLL